MTPEQKASQSVRLGATYCGMKVFRNNTGAFKNPDGQVVRFGLGNESKALNSVLKFGDYVGFTPVIITPEMVGKQIAVMTNIEVKPVHELEATLKKAMTSPRSREAAQLNAINLVRDAGGVAWFASTDDDVGLIYRNYIEGLKKDVG